MAGEAFTYLGDRVFGWADPDVTYDAKVVGLADRSTAIAPEDARPYSTKSLGFERAPGDGQRAEVPTRKNLTANLVKERKPFILGALFRLIDILSYLIVHVLCVLFIIIYFMTFFAIYVLDALFRLIRFLICTVSKFI